MKNRLGRLAYFWTGLRHLRRAASPVTVTVDGRLWFDGEAGCVLLGNVGRITGGIPAFDDARPDDGWLEVGVATADEPAAVGPHAGQNRRGPNRRLSFRADDPGRKIAVRLAAPRTYELDGGSRGMTDRLSVRVVSHAVTVCVPDSATSPAVGRDGSDHRVRRQHTAHLVDDTSRSTPPHASPACRIGRRCGGCVAG